MRTWYAWVAEDGAVFGSDSWEGTWEEEIESWESRGIDVLVDAPDLQVGVEQVSEYGPYLFLWHEP